MDAARQPNIAFELTLLLALATLWGGSYTFIKLGGGRLPWPSPLWLRGLLPPL
jgi:hypothetical protein